MEYIESNGIKVPADWKLREKHWNDMNDTYADLGFFAPGTHRICRFDGKRFFPAIEKLGHSSASYDTCKCHKGDK